MKIKIMFVTTTSKLSGAEKIIYELSKRINKECNNIKRDTDSNIQIFLQGTEY